VEELEMLLEVGFPPSFLPEAMTYQFSLCLVEY
jgi:hypothetical protein